MTEDIKNNDPMGIQDAFKATKAAIEASKADGKVTQEGVDSEASAPVVE